jgi:aryl-alcohol dehydrogenase-like predicted oxidoreductase
MTSPLVLGAMMFGTAIDEPTSFALLDRFVEAGGEWIDTADCYSFWADDSGHGGASEALLGRWFAARPRVRERVKIATKLGAEPSVAGGWPARRQGLSASAVGAAFAGSLERLGIEHVDLLWLHQEDRSVPIEETVDAMGALVASGSVARVGASNHPAWRVERARRHALATGLAPLDALQLNGTYLRPRPGTLPPGVVHPFGVLNDEHRDLAASDGLEVWVYTPLLGGAYDNPRKPIAEVYDHPGNTARLAVLSEAADALGLQRGQVVLSWLVAHGIRPMLGGSKLDQLDLALEGAAFVLPPEWLERLDAVDRPEDVSPLEATP